MRRKLTAFALLLATSASAANAPVPVPSADLVTAISQGVNASINDFRALLIVLLVAVSVVVGLLVWLLVHMVTRFTAASTATATALGRIDATLAFLLPGKASAPPPSEP